MSFPYPVPVLIAWAVAVAGPATGVVDLTGKAADPFTSRAPARVFLFVRTDCPLANRYAPELHRLGAEFAPRGVEFWVVYPDPKETVAAIRDHIAAYQFPGTPLRDPRHSLVKLAEAKVSPEAAVFDASGKLAYCGRIDDRFVDFGKARAAARTHDLEAAIAAVLAGRPVFPARTRAIGCYLADIQ